MKLQLVLLAILAPCLSAQTSSKQLDIYAVALEKGAAEMEKRWGHLPPPSPLDDTEPIDYKSLMVDKSSSVQNAYRESADGRKFTFLTSDELLDRRKRIGKDFSFLVVEAARLSGPRVRVQVTLYQAEIFEGQFAMALSAWATVYFRLDPTANEFVFDSVKLGGI